MAITSISMATITTDVIRDTFAGSYCIGCERLGTSCEHCRVHFDARSRITDNLQVSQLVNVVEDDTLWPTCQAISKGQGVPSRDRPLQVVPTSSSTCHATFCAERTATEGLP